MALLEFAPIFAKEIFPIYINHEKTFDEHKIHGVLHIARSLVASTVIYNEIEKNILKIPQEYHSDVYDGSIKDILFAVSYHDSGRQANGIDYWENVSAENCKNAGHEYASKFIAKNRKTNDYRAMAVYDADVLEIMRPCCGRGSIYGFEKKYLLLLDQLGGFYEKLIPEYWHFILMTEAIKDDLSIPNVIDKLLELIEANKTVLPIISTKIKN